MDNASTDSSAMTLAQEYGARYVFDPVPGLSHARNVGARVCDTDIVAYVDDDAVADPEWLDALAAEFEDPEVAAVVGRSVPLRVETEGERLSAEIFGLSWGPETRLVLDRSTPGWFASAAFGGLGIGANMAFRQSAFEVWPGFDERLGRGMPLDGNEEHYAFFSLARLGYKIVATPQAIVRHPFPPTLDALRCRRLKDRGSLAGFLCLLLVEGKNHRLETLRYMFAKLFGSRPARMRKRVSIRLVSPMRVFLAQLSGPWLYLLSSWKVRKNAESSRALVPYVARALGRSQRAPIFNVQRIRQTSDLPSEVGHI